MGNSSPSSDHAASVAMNQSRIRLARTKAMIDGTTQKCRLELEAAIRSGDKRDIDRAVKSLAVAMVQSNHMADMTRATEDLRRRMELARALKDSVDAMKVAADAIAEALPDGEHMSRTHRTTSDLTVQLEASMTSMNDFMSGMECTTSTDTTDAVAEMVVSLRRQYELELASQMDALPAPPRGVPTSRTLTDGEKKHE